MVLLSFLFFVKIIIPQGANTLFIYFLSTDYFFTPTDNPVINLLSEEEINKKIELVEKNLKSSTWRELETNGKFAKNDKLSFISDDMLIVGCDIGSETHYIRAIDVRGRELSKGAFAFSNTAEGFVSAKAWMMDLAARNDKQQIV